jgi:hypothetical protein
MGPILDPVVKMEKALQIETWRNITDHFSFVEDQLDYADAPLEGFLRSIGGDLYAFRVSGIIEDLLWHWLVLPVPSLGHSVDQIFLAAETDPPKNWLSIVENLRGSEPRLYAAWLTGPLRKAAGLAGQQ